MRGMPKVASDEEDVTLSVLKSVCFSLRDNTAMAAKAHQSDDLWGLLVLICKRKIANLYAYQRRGKRDVSRSESLNVYPELLEEIQSKEIRPEFLAEFNERVESLFESLEKDMLKEVALSKVHGYTNEEIALKLGCSLSTVERKLRLIREIWSRESESA
jgi:RNA polymerase sigma factor (sigma-70 family)